MHSEPGEPTETTALLSTPEPSRRPAIKPTLERVQTIDIEALGLTDIYGYQPPTSPDHVAFGLVVLLQWRSDRLRQSVYSREVWDQWTKETEKCRVVGQLEKHISQLWDTFVERGCESREIEEVLWAEFPEKEAGSRCVRVIDFLNGSDAPTTLLSHRLVYLSLLQTWNYGSFTTGSIFRRFDGCCTPRVSHFIALLSQLVYLTLLIHFLLYPSTNSARTAGTFDIRGYLLIFLAVASLARSFSLSATPFFLVLAAFMSSLPSVPLPGDIPFSILLFAFVLHMLQLHLPQGPSPIFVLPLDFWLPICALLSDCIFKVFFPVLLFFLPLLLMTWSLLFLSLRDTFLRIPALLNALPSPMETRVALFSLLIAEVLLLILLPMLILVIASSSSRKDVSPNNWDRYSEKMGADARRLFMRTVMTYAQPYYFPTPFNLVQLLFLIPLSLLRASGVSSALLGALERVVWRMTVGHVAAIVAGIWGWGMWR